MRSKGLFSFLFYICEVSYLEKAYVTECLYCGKQFIVVEDECSMRVWLGEERLLRECPDCGELIFVDEGLDWSGANYES